MSYSKKLSIILLLASVIFTGNAIASEKKSGTYATLDTNMGKITIELYPNKAPLTVNNFLAYANSGFYEGTIFHRVIKDFMVQGGGFKADMKKKTPLRPSVQNEADNGLKNMRGTIAMARTNAPHSASSQFFINTKDNSFLNHTAKNGRGWGYCVFGKIIDGMEVLTKIENVKKRRGMDNAQSAPIEPIIIKSVKISTGKI